MSLKKLFQRVFSSGVSSTKAMGIEPGLYRYQHTADGALGIFHLRVNPSGNGLLFANAACAVRLHPSGVLIAKGLLECQKENRIVEQIIKAFSGVSNEQAMADMKQVQTLIESLKNPHHDYPILNSTDPSFCAHATPLERPISADVPLCKPFHIDQILHRLWHEGIPHVTFVVGKDPNEKDLVHAVEKGEDLGMITGARGRGSDLAQNRIPDLAQTGLDHLDVYCLSLDENLHNSFMGQNDYKLAIKGLATAKKLEVCQVAVVALVKPTLATLGETLNVLAHNGVVNVCLFAIATTDLSDKATGALHADELIQAAATAEEAAEQYRMRLLWYPPVRYNSKLSLGEQICRGPRASGDSAIRVEPNGDVFPARGAYKAAGNILEQSWEKIAKSDVYMKYRRRLETDTHCQTCPGLAICAADCPRNPEGWAESREKDEC